MTASAAAPDEQLDDYDFAGESRSQFARARRRFFQHRLAAASLFVLVLVFSAGFLAGHLAPYGYQEINPSALSAAPSWTHPFGTDQVGRDYFSRVLYGIGTEAQIALLVAFLGTLIGTLVGAVCGYFGGLIDNVLMRVTDVFLTLPPLITVLIGAVYLDATGLFRISILLACLLWMPVARIVRGTCLSLREREFVDAARAMGASDLRIIGRHVLPNAIGSVAVAASVMTAAAIIVETTLSYLGFGVTRFAAAETGTRLSLGDVMSSAKDEGLFNWWGITFPGLAIVLIVMPIYFIGDGIRDALDPAGRVKVRPRRRPRSKWAPSALAGRLLAGLPRRPLPDLHLGELAGRVHLPTARFELPFLARALSRIRRRRRSRRRLLLEVIAILVVTVGTAGAVYLLGVHKAKSPWRVAGTHTQNVSRALGVQTEASIAVDASNPRVLFAASNDSLERTIRIYSSADGGVTWSSKVGPQVRDADCARGEPSAAIGPDGRQYVAFIVNPFCTPESPYPYLVVASRKSTRARWLVRRVGVRTAINLFDAKPAIATSRDGHVYVAWTRLLTRTYATTVVSSSADGGRAWSRPRVVSRRLAQPQLVSVTVDDRGTLYLAGVDARLGIWIARSGDRGGHFSLRRAAPLPENRAATCAFLQRRYPIPFEANHCNGPNPTVTATGRRAYVTYAAADSNGTQGIRVAVFDNALRLRWGGRVGPPEQGKADQFLPASAVDSTNGRLWTCYYDTSGDPSRRQAWFSCTVSADGRDWATPVRTTAVSANQEVLIEDARIFGFGDLIGYGGYTGLAVTGGTAHPLWIDTRDLGARLQEVFGARLEESAFTH
jgi:glutathione transport system permease protein